MRVKNIMAFDEADPEFLALTFECTACGKGFIGHGRNDSDFFNREVYELACPSCKYQDQPASPCPHCDDVKPELRAVE